MITFDKENKSIRRACDNLGAKYRDTIKGEKGNLIDRHVLEV